MSVVGFGIASFLAKLAEMLGDLWWSFLLGFFLAGLVDEFMPKKRILEHLGAGTPLALLKATLAGLVTSICTCGAIPVAVKLREKGASSAAALTFLMAAPWAGFLQVLVFARFLGWPRALLIFILALTVSFLSGLVLATFERRGWIEGAGMAPALSSSAPPASSCHAGCCGQASATDSAATPEQGCSPPRSSHRLLRALHSAVNAARELWKFMAVGLVLAAAVSAFVPVSWVVGYLGPENPWAIFAALPIAAALELCSEGFSVFAGQLSRMGASLAVVFVTVMVGVATDYTELSVIWGKFGRRCAFAYLVVGTGITLVIGLLLAAAVS